MLTANISTKTFFIFENIDDDVNVLFSNFFIFFLKHFFDYLFEFEIDCYFVNYYFLNNRIKCPVEFSKNMNDVKALKEIILFFTQTNLIFFTFCGFIFLSRRLSLENHKCWISCCHWFFNQNVHRSAVIFKILDEGLHVRKWLISLQMILNYCFSICHESHVDRFKNIEIIIQKKNVLNVWNFETYFFIINGFSIKNSLN